MGDVEVGGGLVPASIMGENSRMRDPSLEARDASGWGEGEGRTSVAPTAISLRQIPRFNRSAVFLESPWPFRARPLDATSSRTCGG
jgi:hypothetical protein